MEGRAMRMVAVQFPSGREVLGSYWGFLKDGGLILGAGPGLDEGVVSLPAEAGQLSEGDPLVLDIRVRTLKTAYRLAGRLVRRSPDGRRAFVAFASGQDQQALLDAAWADTYDVPQRKHRRYDQRAPIAYRLDGGAESRGEMVDVSPGGLRVRAGAPLPVGARVQVRVLEEGLDNDELHGKVRWSRGRNECGIELVRPAPIVQQLLNRKR
jgi:hypothetical protein